jgi:hypothetical protein
MTHRKLNIISTANIFSESKWRWEPKVVLALHTFLLSNFHGQESPSCQYVISSGASSSSEIIFKYAATCFIGAFHSRRRGESAARATSHALRNARALPTFAVGLTSYGGRRACWLHGRPDPSGARFALSYAREALIQSRCLSRRSC